MSRASKNTQITLEWCENCAVRRAELSPSDGHYEAVLYAAENADTQHLHDLQDLFRRHGITTLFDRRDNQDVLIAEGIAGEDALTGLLRASHNISGETKRSTSAATIRRRANTRFLSALFYDLGNISQIISGIARGKHNANGKMGPSDKSEMMTGVAFSVGDVLMTIYKDPEDEMTRLRKGFEAHMKHSGIVLPEKEVLDAETLHKSGLFASANAFLKHNIIPIKCLSETAAGLFMIGASLKKDRFSRGKMAAGMIATTGWVATYLMEQAKPELPGDGGLADMVQQNPRGYVARPAAIINNFSNLFGAHEDRKKYQKDILEAPANSRELELAKNRQHDYLYNVFTACSFLVANYLFGVSEKNGKKRTSEEEQRLVSEMITIAANTLYELPPAMRDEAIKQAANYTAGQPHVTVSAQDVAKAIEHKIEFIVHNRFAQSEHTATTARQSPAL